MQVEFTAYGKPIGQGTIRSFGKGRPSVHSNQETLLPWRDSIVAAARPAMTAAGILEPFVGPVSLTAVFTVKKPKTAPKRTRTWPITRPDLDHLVRALFDALVQCGLLRDDSQVTSLLGAKCYPQEYPNALTSPGVWVWVVETDAQNAGQTGV